MRTITEFASITLKNAAKTQADLLASGKTAEELPVALGEALKLEGDKLNYLVNALEAVNNRFDNLKRVVVSALAEGEKAPTGSHVKQVGEQVYLVEQYPSMRPAPAPAESGRDGKRGGKRGGDRGGRGGDRGGPGGGRGPRQPRGEGKPAGSGPAVKPVAKS